MYHVQLCSSLTMHGTYNRAVEVLEEATGVSSQALETLIPARYGARSTLEMPSGSATTSSISYFCIMNSVSLNPSISEALALARVMNEDMLRETLLLTTHKSNTIETGLKDQHYLSCIPYLTSRGQSPACGMASGN